MDDSIFYYNKIWNQKILSNDKIVIKTECAWYRGILKYVFLNNSNLENKKVLEIGCGVGRLLDFFSCENYTGVDIYPNVKEIIGKRGGLGINGNINSLNFLNDEFDVVICSEVLEHVDTPYLALKEMYRVLKPNGILIITVPTYYNLWYIPMFFAKNGNRYFKNYMAYQLIEKMFVIKVIYKFMKNNFRNFNIRAIRLEPPLFEKILNKFNRISKIFERFETFYGSRVFFKNGLHTLLWGKKELTTLYKNN